MPFDAEPKNGDFAAYVDRLVNRGGHAPGQGLSTEAWAAKASERALAQEKHAGFPTGALSTPKPSKAAVAGKSPVPGTHKIPGSHTLAGNADANAWGREGASTVPMHSVPSSRDMPALGSTTGTSRIQQASDTLAFIIKQFNSRRS
jgi:hypothetical protein